jgi:hypothetical protein
VVRAEEPGDDDADVHGHEPERDDVPALERLALELEERVLAAGERAARVARLAHARFGERRVVAAAAQSVLNAQAAVGAEIAGPHLVQLALERERAELVCDVAGRDEEAKDDPEKESVDGEEGAVVEEDTGPADERSKDAERGGERGYDQLGPIRNPDDVRVVPDVEPGEEGEDEREERVRRQLRVAVSEGTQPDGSVTPTIVLAKKRIHLNRFQPMRDLPLPAAAPNWTPS